MSGTFAITISGYISIATSQGDATLVVRFPIPDSRFPGFMHLPLDRTIGVPIFRQIYDGLRRAILDGRLRPGQRIPSTRSLAADLGVSRLPVLTAYEQLLHEGYLVGRTGSGTFVSESVPDDLLRPVLANTHARTGAG